jgi:hypothetical protein
MPIDRDIRDRRRPARPAPKNYPGADIRRAAQMAAYLGRRNLAPAMKRILPRSRKQGSPRLWCVSCHRRHDRVNRTHWRLRETLTD